ncbi:hypothetical protein HRbin08_00984 [bacterium HR08]|nr:hypothetical protein HRbin08_00984 [bacterium HR08]
MRDPGQQDLLEIPQDRFERFPLSRRMRRQALAHFSRPNPRQDRVPFDLRQILGNPLHELMPEPPKFFQGHVRCGCRDALHIPFPLTFQRAVV